MMLDQVAPACSDWQQELCSTTMAMTDHCYTSAVHHDGPNAIPTTPVITQHSAHDAGITISTCDTNNTTNANNTNTIAQEPIVPHIYPIIIPTNSSMECFASEFDLDCVGRWQEAPAQRSNLVLPPSEEDIFTEQGNNCPAVGLNTAIDQAQIMGSLSAGTSELLSGVLGAIANTEFEDRRFGEGAPGIGSKLVLNMSSNALPGEISLSCIGFPHDASIETPPLSGTKCFNFDSITDASDGFVDVMVAEFVNFDVTVHCPTGDVMCRPNAEALNSHGPTDSNYSALNSHGDDDRRLDGDSKRRKTKSQNSENSLNEDSMDNGSRFRDEAETGSPSPGFIIYPQAGSSDEEPDPLEGGYAVTN